jgi:hypothetical protein
LVVSYENHTYGLHKEIALLLSQLNLEKKGSEPSKLEPPERHAPTPYEMVISGDGTGCSEQKENGGSTNNRSGFQSLYTLEAARIRQTDLNSSRSMFNQIENQYHFSIRGPTIHKSSVLPPYFCKRLLKSHLLE